MSDSSPSKPARSPRRSAFIVGAAILFGSAGALSTAIAALGLYVKKKPITVALNCASIPARTPHWVRIGDDAKMGEATLETLGTKNYVDRAFIEREPADPKNPRLVHIHLAYYTGSVDTVPHVPERCFVAAGGSITGGPWVLPVPLNHDAWIEDAPASADNRAAFGLKDLTIYTARLGPESAAPGNRVRLPRGIEHLDIRISEFGTPGSDAKTYAGYFFIANGGLTSSAQNVRLLSFDLKSDYACYLKVQFTATQIKGPEELAALAGAVLDDLLPDIMLVVPDWTDVIRGDFPADNPRRKMPAPEPGAH